MAWPSAQPGAEGNPARTAQPVQQSQPGAGRGWGLPQRPQVQALVRLRCLQRPGPRHPPRAVQPVLEPRLPTPGAGEVPGAGLCLFI